MKVLLVDDDVPMAKYLEKLIPWDELGITMAGKASSGKKALSLFREHLPEVVVTDIGMPQMDGLELAAKMRGINPDVRIIFLTCHEDFHYARRALELEADDYLIKDGMSADQLKTSLQKAIEKWQQDQVTREALVYRQEIYQSKDTWKQQLLSKLTHSQSDQQGVIQEAKRAGIQWSKTHFLTAVGCLQYASFPSTYRLKDTSLLLYAITNVAEELRIAGLSITSLTDSEAHFVCIANYEPNLLHNYVLLFEQYLESLRDRIEELFKIQVSIVYDSPFKGVHELPQRLKLLLQNVGLRYYKSFSIEKLLQADKKLPVEDISGLNGYWIQIREGVKEADSSKAVEALGHIRLFAQKQEPDPMTFKQHCSQWIRVIELEQTKPSDEIWHSCLLKCSRLEDTMALISDKLNNLLMSASGLRLDVKPKLKKIEQWISDHISEDISLVHISEHLYLNPSYFSRYFKQETGMNFTEYVHRYKMKVACRLLKEEELSIEMIAFKLGYMERTYFSKIFKKYVGVSPRDYR